MVERGQARLRVSWLDIYKNSTRLRCKKNMDALRQQVGTHAAEDKTLIASACNESIAIAIRKGAPLERYSIDRRCMTKYVRDLVKYDTCALICRVCTTVSIRLAEKKYENQEIVC